MNIADVVVDVIDLQYHETVMGMGGDLAAQWLRTSRPRRPTRGRSCSSSRVRFRTTSMAALGATTRHGHVPWCSIGMSADGTIEHDMAETVVALATKAQLRCGHPDRPVRHLRRLSWLQASDLRGDRRV